MTAPPLVLASGSPRRSALLRELGLRFTTAPAEVDESVVPGERAETYVTRLAAAKAVACLTRRGDASEPVLVLAADTTVTLDGTILGKPDDPAGALAMLRILAGRTHEVLTACRLVRSGLGQAAACLTRTRVTFRPWDEALARWYVDTGEPMDKAGAYGLQGQGVLLTAGIDGSWSNVVGLPLEELPVLFENAGDDLFRRLMEGPEPRC